MPRNEVEIALSLQDRMSKPLKNAGTDLERFANKAKKLAIGLGIVGAATTAAVFTVKKFVDQAREQERAVSTLSQVVSNTGAKWADYESQVKSVTSALQAQTNFGDEEQIRALSRIVAITGDVSQAMSILPTVLDAASISGSSLETVAGTLTRALTGQANTAESLGISFEATATFQERLAIAQSKAAGAAEANVDPTIQAANAVGDLGEVIGKVLLPLYDPLVEGMNDATRATATWIDRMVLATGLFDENGKRVEFNTDQWRLFKAAQDGSVEAIRELNDQFQKQNRVLSYVQEGMDAAITTQDGWLVAAGEIAPVVYAATDATITYNRALAIAAGEEQSRQKRLELWILNSKAAQEAEAELREEREKMQEVVTRANQSAFVMSDELDNLVGQLNDNSVALSGLRMLQRSFEDGTLKGTAASEAFGQLLKFVTDEIKAQADAIKEQNNALQNTITLQSQISGSSIVAGNGIPLPESNLKSAFESMAGNAQRRGYNEDKAGNFIGPAGESFNRGTFDQIYNDLFKGGMNAGTALIQTIKTMRRIYNFDTGGVVPGTIGSPQLAVVHGGEQVLTPGQRGGTTVIVNVAGSVISNQDLKNFINRTIVDTHRAGGGRR